MTEPREFSFPTVSRLVREIKLEGVDRFSRSTFYRFVKKHQWPIPLRTGSNWRRFEKDASKEYSLEFYKKLIKEHYDGTCNGKCRKNIDNSATS